MCSIQIIQLPKDRAQALLDILKTRDDRLLPVFCQALKDTGQHHVVTVLEDKGLYLTGSIFCAFMI